jgi:NAD(P)-dependent dehydrogenase (short-subunit alcohol dehydrogenase family)
VFDLNGHVAVMTGGNAGLGLAMARGLVKAGASVAIWARNEARNAEAVAELTTLGGTVRAYACDVTDPAAVEAAMVATLADFGRVDSCFANAGGSGERGRFTALSPESWEATFALNFHSVVSTFRTAAKHMAKREGEGRLIATSSIAALLGVPGGGYSASKAAVAGLVRSLAIELAPAGITVTALLPGYIETEMSLDTPQAFRDAVQRRAASGRIGTLEDMEGIAVFLASAQSRLITGQSIALDGGHTIFPM